MRRHRPLVVGVCGVVTALIAFGCASLARLPQATRTGEDHLYVVAADVNGQPVSLALDTGAAGPVLFRPAAVRLGLKVTEWPAGQPVGPGKVPFGTTERCTLTLWGLRFDATFGVVDIPLALDVDGVLGWPSFNRNILRFEGRSLTLLASLPPDVAGWPKLVVNSGGRTLGVEIPGRAGGTEVVQIDTGGLHGVSLDAEGWRQWTAAHPRRPRTLEGHYMPGAGLRVQEVAWADEIALGPLTLTGVPVREATIAETSLGPRYRATLGRAALRRLDLVVDGQNLVAYVRPKTTPPPPFEHNRAGAVFAPVDVETTDDLVATVLRNSPAWDAGIRDGDLLLRVDETDLTKWRSDPEGPPGRFFRRPAGTRLELTLRRGERQFRVPVVLTDLIGPGVSPRPAP